MLGVPPLPTGEGLRRPLQKFSIFELKKGEFWCILGATFAVKLNGNWLGFTE